MAEIDFDASIQDRALDRDMIDSIRANEIDPRLLYVTLWQVDLWRKVFQRHSPIHGNPEFARIYRDAFARVAETMASKKVWLIGLGCGTGMKEAALCVELKTRDCDVLFSGVDVSRDLVAESMDKIAAAGGKPARQLVGDLAQVEFLAEWLQRGPLERPRVFTFFGLVPNLAPPLVVRLFRAILRPGDVVLVNAHLAPVGEGIDLAAAMRQVRPQYDNPETLAWLAAALDEWKIADRVQPPAMTIGEVDGVPAFVAVAPWRNEKPFEYRGEILSPRLDRPLRLFRSLRYTPSLFEASLRVAGFGFERLAMTACREEAIWEVRHAPVPS